MSRRAWLIVATIGCAFVVIAMGVSTLVVADKSQFGWLVGAWFLPIITSGVIAGGVILLIAAWSIRVEERKWRRYILMAWAVIAVTSPLFGILFLLPWCILAVMLPFVVASLVSLFRANAIGAATSPQLQAS